MIWRRNFVLPHDLGVAGLADAEGAVSPRCRSAFILGNFAPPPAFVADAPELLFRRAALPPPIQAGGVDPPAGVAGGHDSVPGHLSSRPPALSRCPDDFAGSAETGR